MNCGAIVNFFFPVSAVALNRIGRQPFAGTLLSSG
jgi:hypothetical protein